MLFVDSETRREVDRPFDVAGLSVVELLREKPVVTTPVEPITPVVAPVEPATESKLTAGIEPNLETNLAGEKTAGTSYETK